MDLLEEAEALELVEFDPKVDPKDTWRDFSGNCHIP